MKTIIKRKFFLLGLIGLISLLIIPIDYVIAYKNAPYGPNSETPDKRKYYNFIDTGSGIFQNSHYSTHDWIADAALRLLLDETD